MLRLEIIDPSYAGNFTPPAPPEVIFVQLDEKPGLGPLTVIRMSCFRFPVDGFRPDLFPPTLISARKPKNSISPAEQRRARRIPRIRLLYAVRKREAPNGPAALDLRGGSSRLVAPLPQGCRNASGQHG